MNDLAVDPLAGFETSPSLRKFLDKGLNLIVRPSLHTLVVGLPKRDGQVPAVVGEPARDRGADSRPATNSGDERNWSCHLGTIMATGRPTS